MDLTIEQKADLVRRAISWVAAADEYSDSSFDPHAGNLIVRGHFVVVALAHLCACLRHLSPSAPERLQTPVAEMLAHRDVIVDVRNKLEHEEEYLAGVGKYQYELSSRENIRQRGAMSLGWGGTVRLTKFEVLGIPFEFERPLAAALALRPGLVTWEAELSAELANQPEED